jgi:hypothetical protein
MGILVGHRMATYKSHKNEHIKKQRVGVFDMRKSKIALRFVAFSLVVSVCVGCSALGGRSGSNTESALDSAVGSDPSVTPFKLDVLQESSDGETLLIRGQVVSKTSRPANDVLVRLTALDDSGEKRTSFHKLKDLNPNTSTLQAGKATQFSLSLPAQGLSNYQLEVLWGKDALPYLGDARASMKAPNAPSEYLALRNLEVHRVPDGSCSSPEECLVTFSIKGEFFNAGKAVVRDVILVAGFSPANKMGLPNSILENERKIEIKNVGLGPQATRPFRLTLEKLVPASDTVAYQPVVRIVAFDSE